MAAISLDIKLFYLFAVLLMTCLHVAICDEQLGDLDNPSANTTTPNITTTSMITTTIPDVDTSTDATNNATGNDTDQTTAPPSPETTSIPLPTTKEFRGNLYTFVLLTDNGTTFEDAQKSCQSSSVSNNLVSIQDEEENDFVRTLFADSSNSNKSNNVAAWIGLSKENESSEYKWLDGTDLIYVNWEEDNPVNNSNNCVVISQTNGTWTNEDCNTQVMTFICKKPIGLTTSDSNDTSSIPPTKDPGKEDDNPGGLSQSAVLGISIATIVVVISIILGGILFYIKKKRTIKMDAFSLIDNDDFVNANTVTMGDSY